LAKARPGIRVSELAELLNLDGSVAETLASRDSAVELDAKRQIVAAFDAMAYSRDESKVARLWATIIAAESVLAAEIDRKLREDEARNE
jgi:hypothetical protein